MIRFLRRAGGRTTLWVIIGLVVVASIAAATYWWTIRDARERPAGPPEAVTLALIGSYPGTALLYLAQRNGDFAAEGLQVNIKSLQTGKATMDALAGKQADFTASGDLPIMFAIAKGESVAIVANVSTADRDMGIVARAENGIRSVADLKGKRIAVSIGTASQFVLDSMLLRAGLGSDQAKLFDMPPGDMPAALSGGKVDAAATWEPTLGVLKNQLGAAATFLSGEGVYTTYYAVAAQRDFVAARPETVKKLLRALVRAERFYVNQPETARKLIAETTQATPDQVRDLLANYRINLSLDQSLLVALESEYRWAFGKKLLPEGAPPNFAENFYTAGMLAVKPLGVSVIH